MRRPSGDALGKSSAAGLLVQAGLVGAVRFHHVDLKVSVTGRGESDPQGRFSPRSRRHGCRLGTARNGANKQDREGCQPLDTVDHRFLPTKKWRAPRASPLHSPILQPSSGKVNVDKRPNVAGIFVNGFDEPGVAGSLESVLRPGANPRHGGQLIRARRPSPLRVCCCPKPPRPVLHGCPVLACCILMDHDWR